MIVSAKDIHLATGFRYSWINKHFGCIANDYFDNVSNTYDTNRLKLRIMYIIADGLHSKNIKQNEKGIAMLKATLEWLQTL